LLQQTTQVQIRFFIQLLQQKVTKHPVSGVLSPANFDKGKSKCSLSRSAEVCETDEWIAIDPLSNRLSDAMNRLSVNDSARNSMARNSIAGAKRQSGLDPATVNAMFPDVAAAIALEKAKYTQKTGNPPTSNRNSTVDRDSLAAPTISAPNDDAMAQNPQSPWGQSDAARPKSSSGQQPPMGQFVAPQAAAGGLRSPRPPQLSGNSNIQSTTLSTNDKLTDLPVLSPYANGSGNWASMVNTPLVSNFGTVQSPGQAEMVANAAAMKLAALSTVNNRFALDDVRKYRRARSNEAPQQNLMMGGGQMAGMQPTSVVMVNEHGQIVGRDQQLFNNAGPTNLSFGGRSRPSSPGLAMQGGFAPVMNLTAAPNTRFLSAYDNASIMGMNGGLAPMQMGGFSMGHEGYLSDHSDMVRGRSPRGRRGSSKPPEDPTDPSLLQDIPSWLRSLRLHKYTDNLKDMKWTDLVEMDDKQLEERGVNALGARRKMLKVFEEVKSKTASS
jgi:hypothetical protein